MANVDDFKDMTIRWINHPKYRTDKIIEDQIIEVIVQKLEMLLYTEKNSVLGQDSYGFGSNIEYYLWQTTFANDVIKGDIVQQINKWIPELNSIGYTLDVVLYEGTIQDIMHLDFVINGYNIQFLFQ